MKKHVGSLEVITGSMFSGKSEELIRRIRRAKYAKQKLLVFSPKIDNRYGVNGIYSHNKNNVNAYSVDGVPEMLNILHKHPDVEIVGIDEVQFFDEKVVDFCKECVNLGKRVIVAGLDLDFKAEPFKPLPELMAIADYVEKLSAICTICGNKAYASQRLINGEPAFDDDPLVAIGSVENYEARCRLHHIVKKRSDIKELIEIAILLNVEKKNLEKISKFSDYKIIELNVKNEIQEIRDMILESHKKNNKLVLCINESISFKIKGNYEILDLIIELIKKSKINIVSNGDVQNLLTTCSLLNKCDLKISNIYLTSNKEVIEEVEKDTGIKIKFIGGK